jgi:hypothetical protein
MKAHHRNINKLASSRSKAIKDKRMKYGKPSRKKAMQHVMVDHYMTQDREASKRYSVEQELRKISSDMFGNDKLFKDLTSEQLAEVVDQLNATEFTSEVLHANEEGS